MGKGKIEPAKTKIEEKIALILMKAGVIGPDIDDCLVWAFGPNALYVPIYPDWIDRWRKLHPQHPVKKSDSFVEWMYVVGFLYVAYQKKKMSEKDVRGIFKNKFNMN